MTPVITFANDGLSLELPNRQWLSPGRIPLIATAETHFSLIKLPLFSSSRATALTLTGLNHSNVPCSRHVREHRIIKSANMGLLNSTKSIPSCLWRICTCPHMIYDYTKYIDKAQGSPTLPLTHVLSLPLHVLSHDVCTSICTEHFGLMQ